jgi:hypothetical protein
MWTNRGSQTPKGRGLRHPAIPKVSSGHCNLCQGNEFKVHVGGGREGPLHFTS